MLNSGGFFFSSKGPSVKYSKPPLTFEEQADQLLARGLIAEKDLLIQRLKAVSYYRLSGYWYPFRNPGDIFRSGTSLDVVWRRYVFDRQLRLLVMDGIERVEVSIRTSLIYHFTHGYGPFGYEQSANLPNLASGQHAELLDKFAKEQARSKEVFVTHFKNKYGNCHERLPLWMAAEVTTFGMLLTMFRGTYSSTKKQIAGDYGVSDHVLESWLLALNSVRNICAHHDRLWNRELGYKPIVPKERKHPEWHRPVVVGNNRVFVILTILKYMLNQVAPQSAWPKRLHHLLDEYPEIPLIPMGFPENWQECPIWAKVEAS